MIALNNVGKWRKCNIWINDIPEIKYDCVQVLSGAVVKSDWIKWDNVSYVVEVKIIGRDCSNYALLGLKYEYKQINELAIKVNVGQFNGEIIERGISRIADEIHSGLPLEYAEQVFDVAKNFLKNTSCSSGEITFDIAAHGHVGSSESVFRLVTEVLLQLLVNNNKTDIDKIEKIIFNQLNPQQL